MPTETLEPTTGHAHKLAGKYLTFDLHGESYGVNVLKIREIIRLTNITAVPQMPEYVRGVINLRGKIIPVMDLRSRFGFPASASSEHTCIMVVQVHLSDAKSTQMGVIVDGVEEVLNIAGGEIEETPSFGSSLSTECILGMAKIKGRVKTLLDIDRVTGAEASACLTIQPEVAAA